MLLKEMETFSFDYATKKGYTFPKYAGRDGLMALKDIFDMHAGTSTGSILAAGLVYPDSKYIAEKQPRFFADDLISIYSDRAGEIFMKNNMSWVLSFFLVILFGLIFSAVGYFLGRRYFDNPKIIKAFKKMREAINSTITT